jgi:elongation factor P hydroxylase
VITHERYERWFNEEARRLDEEYGYVYLSKLRARMVRRAMEHLEALPAPLRWLEMARLELLVRWARLRERN